MALILLALIWFKSNAVTLFVTFLVVFPLITQNVAGPPQVDPQQGACPPLPGQHCRVLRDVSPGHPPLSATGAAAGLGLTWKVMIAAEVLANPPMGIGTQMDTAGSSSKPPRFCLDDHRDHDQSLFDRLLYSLLRRQLFYWE